MTKEFLPGERSGEIVIPASKSQAHRAVILAALGRHDAEITCKGISNDIVATASCMNSAGANIEIAGNKIHVSPVGHTQRSDTFECGESGSTLRFLIPVFGALGVEGEFIPKGRLIDRPLSPLDEVLKSHGMSITKTETTIKCSGRLTPGEYEIPGDVSSQYITGLLLALPLLDGDSTLRVTGVLQSKGYVAMTEELLLKSGIEYTHHGDTYRIKGNQKPDMGDCFTVEGDYSNAAFYLCMGALSSDGVAVMGLNPDSSQGDKAVISVLKEMGADVTIDGTSVTVRRGELHGVTIDASQIPDLIPTLSAVASVCEGETHIINAGRLRIKESDRIASTCALINNLGGNAKELSDGIIITGVKNLAEGTVDSCNDHRIAMSAAVAACASTSKVTVLDSMCVRKSYPDFWEDFATLNIKS
ncbi:MAG: 3-phosphoshikimate 1-carboxyvinyltransferase [Oscillospiraceae bacterium]|nr:3-phosphoshikimate 1-carboxyvinyltransferase [Oscillospiraceae bacterium]